MAARVGEPGIATRKHPLRVERVQPRRQRVEVLRLRRALQRDATLESAVELGHPGLAGIDRTPRRADQPVRERGQGLRLWADPLPGARQTQRDAVQRLRMVVEELAHPTLQQPRGRGQGLEAGLARRRGELGRGGRGRRAQVGSQIGERQVGFVPDPADHRQARGRDRPHHALVVEGPEVFERATTATHDQGIDLAARARQRDRRCECGRCVRSLHQARIDDHLHLGRAPRQCGQHVVQRRRAQRSHDPDATRVGRKHALAHRIEQTLGFELGLQPQELLVERAGAGTLHRLDDELEFTTRLIQAKPAMQLDALAVGRREGEQGAGAAKHHATQHRAGAVRVFQVEVAVATRGTRKPRDFAADTADAKAQADGFSHLVHQLRHTPDRAQRPCGGRVNHAQTQCRSGSRTPQPRQTRAGRPSPCSRRRHDHSSC